MQEVTIKPRSAFKHYVTVDSYGKELCWNFGTKKKNISFGLFKKVQSNLSSSPRTVGTPVLSTPALLPSPRMSIKGTRMSRSDSKDGRQGSLSDVAVGLAAPASSLLGRKSVTGEPELVEILPVSHYDSSHITVKGSYTVPEPGTYVLLFDNTFSKNTSKKLYFFVNLKDIEHAPRPPTADGLKSVEGWILKKGNKKMQGYAKRWMKIDPNGVLTYSKIQNGESRALISLDQAAVRLDHDHLLIDIDSGQTLLHLKAQSPPDFQLWVSALQEYAEDKNINLETDEDILLREQAAGMLEESDSDIEGVQRKAELLVSTLTKELASLKDIIDTSRGRVDTKTQWKDFILIINSLSDVIGGLVASGSNMQRSLTAYAVSLKSQREKWAWALRQHDLALKACLADNNKVRRKFGLEPVSLDLFFNAALSSSPSTRASTLQRPSAREDMFFDAEEGESDVDESDSSSFGADDDDYRYSAEEEFEDDVAPFDDDEDEEEGQGPVIDKTTGKESNEAILVTSVPVSPSDVKPNPDDHATENPADGTPPEPPKYAQPVVRRKTLPAPTTSMENISIMSLLRNNVGKDLSTVAMPILLNEPINLLQKLAEELEYCELLQEANNAADPADRIALIAAFAVSGYSSSVNRPGRKPFNPLLGETYECLREDKGFRYISEKVSHHPPIMACHADSDAYTFYQDNLLKSKFWGKSMELIPSGSVHVQLKSTGELYVWNKVTTCMRNIFSTGRYLEHYGVMKITCAESGLTAQLSFKESGYFVSAKNEITGSVLSASGQELFQLSGKWDEGLYRFHSSSPNNLEVLWRARPCPPHHSQMYGFTAFTVELNDLTPDLIGVLPNTDTRYRPDQRMYEEGRVDDAEKEKQRLEQKQREYRKRLEAEGKRWEPQFFELKPNEGGGEATWTYRGGYWEKREKRAFEPQLDLFS